eukprot:4323928-Pleurochrysis_carterae.AAC.1
MSYKCFTLDCVYWKGFAPPLPARALARSTGAFWLSPCPSPELWPSRRSPPPIVLVAGSERGPQRPRLHQRAAEAAARRAGRLVVPLQAGSWAVWTSLADRGCVAGDPSAALARGVRGGVTAVPISALRFFRSPTTRIAHSLRVCLPRPVQETTRSAGC